MVSSISGEGEALVEGLSLELRPEMPSALQSKEEELQCVLDQLQQAREERDCHLKTISSLKQVTACPMVLRHTPGLGLQ